MKNHGSQVTKPIQKRVDGVSAQTAPTIMRDSSGCVNKDADVAGRCDGRSGSGRRQRPLGGLALDRLHQRFGFLGAATASSQRGDSGRALRRYQTISAPMRRARTSIASRIAE